MKGAANMASSAAAIVDLGADQLDAMGELLALAFANDPLARYFFADDPALYAERTRAHFRSICAAHLAAGAPILGIREGETLRAVMCLRPPEVPPAAGAAANERVAAYLAVAAQHPYAKPHFEVDLIGVHPGAQGRRFGRALLDLAQARSQSHPTSAGVYLNTANARNVEFYQHCGYELAKRTAVGPVTLWFLFRANAEL
jgi:ribosomal protein S18 acetylase RimI-like enzyme